MNANPALEPKAKVKKPNIVIMFPRPGIFDLSRPKKSFYRITDGISRIIGRGKPFSILKDIFAYIWKISPKDDMMFFEPFEIQVDISFNEAVTRKWNEIVAIKRNEVVYEIIAVSA